MNSIPTFDDYYPVKTFYTDRDDYLKTDLGKSESYAELFEEIHGITIKKLIEANESHSANILLIDHEDSAGRLVYVDETHVIKDGEGFDAMITDVPGIMLAIRTADCVPVFLYDRVKQIVGMVHSGWRGTLRRIVPHSIKIMEQYYGSRPEDIIAAFGPSICAKCYEVGEDVLKLFSTRFHSNELSRYFVPKGNDKYYFDGKEIIRNDMIQCGIEPDNIYDTKICSYESDNYASFRREKVRNLGMQTVSGIMRLDATRGQTPRHH